MKNKGQNLVEFIIIMALVVLAGVIVLTMLGQNVSNLFSSSTKKAEKYKPFEYQHPASSTGIPENVIPESIGGTVDNPKTECVNDSCIVDFEDFVLSDIPLNFNNVVKSTGTSGGTETVVNIFKQISSQLEAKGDTEGSTEFKNIANLAHLIARMQEGAEKAAVKCQDQTDVLECFGKETSIVNNMHIDKVPENVQDILPEFGPDKYGMAFGAGENYFRIDQAIHLNKTDKEEFENGLDHNPAYAYTDLYFKILDNPKYSDELKGVTMELTQIISDMSTDHFERMSSAQQGLIGNNFSYYNRYDLQTGEMLEEKISDQMDSIIDLTKPETSIKTDFNSVLICATGKYKDSSKECY